MLVESENLVGATELAREHGVGNSCIAYWAEREGFPEPVIRLACGAIYDRTAVAAWVVANNRGAPKKRYVLHDRRTTKGNGGWQVWDRHAKTYVSDPLTLKREARTLRDKLEQDQEATV